MEDSVTRFTSNNQSNENTSVEEENPLAFITSDYFLSSGPEDQQFLSGRRKRKHTHERQFLEKAKRSKEDDIDNNINENMIGKFVTTKTTLTLAKSASIKVKKARPNYFLSVRLDSQGIRENFNEFFNYVTKKFPEYKKLLINPQQIHITLFVLHLEDDDIRNAKNCLLNSKEIMKETCPNCKPSLHFQGIDTFDGGRIVYTIPKNNDDLVTFTKLTFALHKQFQREGLVDNDIKKEFKPHATLMKLRRKIIIRHKDGEKKEVVKRIPPEIYEHFKGFDFGTHCLESVELSSMFLPKDDDGYYNRLENIEF